MLVADLGIDQVVVYAFDADTGSLIEVDRLASAPGLAPRHMTWHPKGTSLYVAHELDCTVTRYLFDAAAGRFTAAETLPTLPDSDPATTVADIHLNPAADRLFVSNRGHNSVVAYRVAVDGTLAGLGAFPCGGNWPRKLCGWAKRPVSAGRKPAFQCGCVAADRR